MCCTWWVTGLTCVLNMYIAGPIPYRGADGDWQPTAHPTGRKPPREGRKEPGGERPPRIPMADDVQPEDDFVLPAMPGPLDPEEMPPDVAFVVPAAAYDSID